MSNFGLKLEEIKKIKEVFKKYNVKKVIIYGSRALGTSRPNSDIDLTIEDETLNLSDLLKIESDLDDLLLPYKMDISLKKNIEDKEILKHIKTYGKTF